MVIRFTLLSFVVLSLVSCAGNKLDSELEDLEKPPQLVDFSTFSKTYPAHTENDSADAASGQLRKRQNFDVLLSDKAGRDTMISIVQPYDKAWSRVAQALNHNAFEVTDRDRQSGLFYVSYDPDYKLSGWDKTISFFIGNAEFVNDFHLKLFDNNTVTEITAEMMVDDDSEDDQYADPDAEVEKFLLLLYKILREQ